MLFVVRCLSFDVLFGVGSLFVICPLLSYFVCFCCLLVVVCWLLFVVCCLSFVVLWSVVGRWSTVVCQLLFEVCVFYVACSAMFAVNCLLPVVGYVLIG